MSTDWKDFEKDSKQKYNAYLCSREWAVLKEQVRKRSGGKCERCKKNEMDACHHLTYERKYKEKLEDLQAICTPCHEFTHSKSDVDPCEPKKRPHPWELYCLKCYEAGKRPVGMEWLAFGVPESERDAVEIAVHGLWQKYREFRANCDRMIYWGQDCEVLENVPTDIVEDYYLDAAREIDGVLLNTGMYLWCYCGSPEPKDYEHWRICNQAFEFLPPKDMPTRKGGVEDETPNA